MQAALAGSVVLIAALVLLNVYASTQITSLEASESLLAEQVGDYEIELGQKANQILTLEDQIGDLSSKYNLLNSTCSSLNSTYANLNETYTELQRQYEDLLFHYNLLNEPASNFTTVADLEIEIAVDYSIYYYQDPVAGNVTITYLNGTAFKGTFILYIRHLPTESMSTTAGFAVDGFTAFYLSPPIFLRGPGNYTIGIASLADADGYIIENRWAVFPSVLVEAK